ncbi:MAG: hypothetical protein BXU00_00420 [Candidatus Nanoclepta minutus]|uniref:Alanine--tRNA ligase n=1 Tax=Candidatus Nanoclepta minutus TaxID=1940235 RepID=A0A397WPY5_9ARCH|nr:MAG: hypothetical protein BXU00_00420 [Candidatus Nanoclepta minutus]
MKFSKSEELSKDLEKFFPVRSLKDLGYKRRKCKFCGKYFWSKNDRDFCGDHEPYSFIGREISERKSYFGVWEDIKEHFSSKNYLPIKRYPVVARWRDDLDFVIASITVFQPWVTDGIVKPPSEKVIIPQFSLRFNDVENVGLTGRHYTGFVMIGQHAFVDPKDYDIDSYFLDLYEWFEKKEFPIEDFVFHEDVWSGGGNAGTCLEFFIYGLEVANQVYMQYKVVNNEWKELYNLKILDVGIGHERLAWIMGGTVTSYETVFPRTVEFLKKNLKVDIDYDLLSKAFSLAANFDFNERSFEEFVKLLKEKLGKDLRKEIESIKAVYAISDHLRSLYIAISDGALPSNIGGNYNLRFIARRAFGLLDKYFDNLSLEEVLRKISEDWFENEPKNNIGEILEILEYERKKYLEVRKKAKSLIGKIRSFDAETLFNLYTSYGISPEIIKENIDIQIPKEFYDYLEKHKSKSRAKTREKGEEIDISGYPETSKEFYKSWKIYYGYGRILGIKDRYVIFDKTVFFPEKGGQRSDEGWIFFIDKLRDFSSDIIKDLSFPDYVKDLLKDFMRGNKRDLNEFESSYARVLRCLEVKNVLLHEVDRDVNYSGDVLQVINREIRYRTSRHHTAVHILTGVLRKKYGNHVWQAGAEKDEKEGRLDVTHYEVPSIGEIMEIEREINRIISEGKEIKKYILRRDEAERKYGFSIYQGGFIPEVNLRIIEIEGLDAEACSGTHLDNTSELGIVKIVGVEKIADGLIRFRIIAGDRVIEEYNKILEKIREIKEKYGINIEDIEKYIEKLDKERNYYNKLYYELLEYIVRSMIKDGRLIGKIDALSGDVLRILYKIGDLKEVELETKDYVISSKEGEKKVGKFYLKKKS